MCGIALILSGAVRIAGPDLCGGECNAVGEAALAVDDLKATLLRRGPDHLSTKKLVLPSDPPAELQFIGATLHLRGLSPVLQPLADASGNILVYNGEIFGGIHVGADCNDTEGLLHALEKSCLCDSGGHGKACSEVKCKSIPEILSAIRGPWALIYWQQRSKTIWFGRDSFGRRSLLVHWPARHDSQLVLSSVSPSSTKDCGPLSLSNGFEPDQDSEAVNMACPPCYWEELPCGIYSIQLEGLSANEHRVAETLIGEVQVHEWTDPLLRELIKWDRTVLDAEVKELSLHCAPARTREHALYSYTLEETSDLGEPRDHLLKQATNQADNNGVVMKNILQKAPTQPALKVLTVLKDSVMRRTALNMYYQISLNHSTEEEPAPIAVLFSGGLDSMILAALLDQCLDSKYAIDLLNVSFDGQLAPDRASAKVGIRELQKIAPDRRWRLVEIDSCLSNLTWETKHLMSLIHPARTYMDLNIGIALWLAAGGDGWVDSELFNHNEENCHRYRYKSTARVLLVGSGADEQCAGYGRHKTKFRLGGWDSLEEEMRLDMQRIWKRNLGRDDRCISDHGKEARFPFLDEIVIKTLLEIPLWEIANLDEPIGRGDKKILREVARLLGLEGAAIMPKRAIQFGSRIARESNKANFGSNRAANLASAGSVEIREKKI